MIYKVDLRVKGEKGVWKTVYVNTKDIQSAMIKAIDHENKKYIDGDFPISFEVVGIEETNLEIIK